MSRILFSLCIWLSLISQVWASAPNAGPNGLANHDANLSTFLTTLTNDCTPNSVPFCASQAEGLVDQVICVEVTALNFFDIAAFQFTLEFDTAIVEFSSIDVNIDALPDLDDTDFNFDDIENGLFTCAYFSEIGFGNTLEDGTPLFTICYVAKAVGTSPVNFTSSVTPAIVINGDLQEVPFTAGCGSVTVLPCLDVTNTIDTTICEGESVLIGGTIFTVPDTYQIDLFTPEGCDSTIILNLVVDIVDFQLPSLIEVCEGDQAVVSVPTEYSVGFPGGPFGQMIMLNPGTYVLVVVDNVTGCELEQIVEVVALPLPDVIIEGQFFYCVGGATEIFAVGADTYEWSTGETTQGIVVDMPGEYTVIGTDENGCQNLATVIIEEFPLPEVEIIGELAFCAGETTELTAVGAVEYIWSTGDQTASIIVSIPGEYTVIGTDENGCQNEATVIVQENPLPNIDIIGALSFCAGEFTEVTAVGAETYEWSTGETTETIIISEAGGYFVTGFDENGCQSTIQFSVEELPLPEVEILGELAFCFGEGTQLTAVGAETYEWSTGETTESIIAEAPGDYSVTGTDANGCQNVATVSVEELPLPDVVITGELFFCAGSETTLTADGAVEYVWSTGDQGPVIAVSIPGEYSVTGIDANGCENTATVIVEELPLPIAEIIGDPFFCEGEFTELTAIGGVQYEWSTGETTETITVQEPGIYEVIVTDNNGCQSITEVEVVVLPLPQVGIEGIFEFCAGTSTLLEAFGAETYEWSTGETTPAIEVSIPGDYTVVGTDANGCQNIATVTITELPLPLVEIQGPTAFCNGDEIELTAVGAEFYVWNTGDQTPTIVVSTPGVYEVTGTDANGCVNVASVTVEELPLPDVGITGVLTFCAGETTILEAFGAETYEWSTGETGAAIEVGIPGEYSVVGTDENGCQNFASVIVEELPLPDVGIQGVLEYCAGTSTELFAFGGLTYEWSTGETTESIVVSAPGDYTVVGTDENGCQNSATVFVTELPLPPVMIVGELKYCAGSETVLVAEGAETYEWSTGETGPEIVASQPGTYSVTGTDAFGCENVAFADVVELPLPEVEIIGDLNYCPGEFTTLEATGALFYLWSTGDASPSILVTEPGEYSVTGTDANGCQNFATVIVEEYPTPDITIDGVLEICVGQTTTLTANGGLEYEWNTGELTPSIEVSAGEYTVIAVDENGCIGEATVVVIELPLPDVGIDGGIVFCEGSETELVAFGAETYVWSTGETGISIIVDTPGTYNVTGTDANGCENVAEITVEVIPAPIVEIDGDVNYCPNNPQPLTASGAFTYEWSTGETTETIIPTGPGVYEVTGTDSNGCIGVASIELLPDTEPPVFVFCPNDVVEYLNQGIGEVNVFWNEPLAEDNCGDPITITQTSFSGDGFPLGTTPVTYTAVDASGNEAVCEFNVVVEPTADLTFYVDTLDYTQDAQGVYCVPVEILGFSEVVGFQFTVSAPDLTNSQIVSIEPSDELSGGNDIEGFSVQEIAPGVFAVLWVDETGQGLSLPDSSAVFNVKMTIDGGAGDCVPLVLSGDPLSAEAFQLPFGAVVPTLISGDICVRGFINITGETYKIDFDPIKDTDVTLEGPDLLNDLTDAAGRYEFMDLAGGEDYSIIPMRDFDHNEGLSVIDMVIIIRHIRFIELIENPYLLIAADVNNTSGITISDVIEIREIVLGNQMEFMSNTSWRFIPVDYVFPDPAFPWFPPFPEQVDLVNQAMDIQVDFYGMKIGDVDLSASGQLQESDGTLQLQVHNQSFEAGDLVEIPVRASDFDQVAGFQMELSFDANALHFVDAAAGDIPGLHPVQSFGLSQVDNGQIAVLWYETETIQTEEENPVLFTLYFEANNSGSLASKLRLTELNLSNIAASQEAIPMDIELVVNSVTSTDEELEDAGLSILSSSPNPFRDRTMVTYNLPEAGLVSFSIFDVNGKLVYNAQSFEGAGINDWMIEQGQLLGAGVYTCHIKTEKAVEVIRIVNQE